MPDSIQINGRFHLDECQINAGYLLSSSPDSYCLCLFVQLKSSPLHSFAEQRGWRPLCTWRGALLNFVKQSELLAGNCNSRPCGGFSSFRGSWLKTCEASLPGTRHFCGFGRDASMTLMFLTEFWILWPPFRFHGPPMLPGLQWWCRETRLCPTSMYTVLWISTFLQCLLDSRWLLGICGCPFFISFVPQAGFLTSLRFLHGVKRQRAPWHISSTQQCWRPWRRITTSLWRIPLCGRCHSR